MTSKLSVFELLPDKTKKQWLKVKLQQDTKIQLSYDWNQSTFGSSSTILNPLTEVRGQKISLNGQQAVQPWRKDAGMVKKFGFQQLFRPLTSVQGWRMVWGNFLTFYLS